MDVDEVAAEEEAASEERWCCWWADACWEMEAVATSSRQMRMRVCLVVEMTGGVSGGKSSMVV